MFYFFLLLSLVLCKLYLSFANQQLLHFLHYVNQLISVCPSLGTWRTACVWVCVTVWVRVCWWHAQDKQTLTTTPAGQLKVLCISRQTQDVVCVFHLGGATNWIKFRDAEIHQPQELTHTHSQAHTHALQRHDSDSISYLISTHSATDNQSQQIQIEEEQSL